MSRRILFLIIAVILLTIPAFYNGYPLVYSDTGTYVWSGKTLSVPIDRPITYGLFIAAVSFMSSMWAIIFAQNLILAFVLYEVISVFIPEDDKRFLWTYFGITLFLTLFTGMAWYSNTVMPDIYAPIFVLIIFILLYKKSLAKWETVLLYFLLVFSLAVHLSHLLIAVFLMGCIFILYKFFGLFRELDLGRLTRVFVVVVLSWLVIPTINYIIEKNFILNKSSHTFFVAHLSHAGILEKFLRENCDKPEYQNNSLCKFKDKIPRDLAGFLWDEKGIVQQTDGWKNKKDYNQVIKGVLTNPKYLYLVIHRGIIYGFIQLFRNKVGEGLSAYNENSAPYYVVKGYFYNELNDYFNSRQNKWNGINLKFDTINTIHSFLLIVSLFLLIFLLTTGKINEIDNLSRALLYISLFAIVINSFVTASLQNPYDRYQARIVWLLLLTMIFIIIKNRKVIFNKLFDRSK